MVGLWDLSLLRPMWLVALPVLALATVYLARRRAGIGDWSRAVDPALMEGLKALGRVHEGRATTAHRAALAAAALIALALVGPATERRDAVAFRNLDGVVFVLDASPSMTGGDDWAEAILMARYGLTALGSRPAGLIVFAGDAYVAGDMSGDLRELDQTLALVDAATVPDPGSRPARALAMAATMLAEAKIIAGDVVLVSDGGGLGPEALAEAEAIRGLGARLSVIRTAAAAPEPLAALAAAGGGRVFGPGDAEALRAHLSETARQRLERQNYPLPFFADHGRLLLILAAVPALLLFRRSGEATP